MADQSQVLVAPDVEVVFPKAIFQKLSIKYPRLYTDRAAPQDLAGRPTVVCHRQGGLSKGRMLDQARMQIDVYAPTEKMANDLALDVRAVVESMMGHAPVIKVETTGPAPIVDAGKGPQRRFYADALIRKATR